MKWNDVERHWPALVGSLQSRWPDLVEEDLLALTPTRDELVDLVARSAGEPVPEAGRQVDIWLEGPMPSDAFADPVHDDAAIREAARYVPEGEDVLSDDSRFGDDAVPATPIGRDR